MRSVFTLKALQTFRMHADELTGEVLPVYPGIVFRHTSYGAGRLVTDGKLNILNTTKLRTKLATKAMKHR
jgi:hypothetical protein